MNTPGTILPLPDAGVMTDVVTRIRDISYGNDYAFFQLMGLLNKYPALARTDEEACKSMPGKTALIFHAAKCKRHLLFLKCMEKGSSPLARNAKGHVALMEALKQSNCTEDNIDFIEKVLEHPDCKTLPITGMVTLGPPNSRTIETIPLHCAGQLMRGNTTEELEKRRCHIFSKILKRTPPALRATQASLTGLYPHWDQTSEKTSIFMLRELADRGVDLDICTTTQDSHPLRQAVKGERVETAAALWAAGIDPKRRCIAFTSDRGFALHTIGEYFACLPGFDAKSKKFVDETLLRARMMLDRQVERITKENEKPRAVLYTDEGTPSWQAQGLAMNGRLNELFDEKYAEHFGGRDKQLEFAFRLEADLYALALRQIPPGGAPYRGEGYYAGAEERFRTNSNFAALLCDTPLARPSDSAVVEYVRGGVAEVGRGGKA